MKPPSIHRQTGLLSAAIVALIGLCLVWALAGQSSSAAGGAFDSPLRPTHTPKPTRTPKAGISPIPTLGAFVSPLSTPTPMRVPFVRPYYGPPTPGLYVPQATATLRPASPRAPGSRLVFLPVVMHNFPTYLTYGRKGIGDGWQNWATPTPFLGTTPTPGPTPTRGTNLAALDYGWYYDWRFGYLPKRDKDTRYARMVFCELTSDTDIYGVTRSITEIARADYNAGLRGRVWLIYNEPDILGQCTYFYGKGIAAARHFSIVYDMIKTGDPFARVFGGGLVHLGYPEAQAWWQDFVRTLRNDGVLYKLEGVHVHLYPYVSTAPIFIGCVTQFCVGENMVRLAQVANDWYQHQHIDMGLTDRPLWITETGWIYDQTHSREWVRDNIMTSLSQWFAQDPAWPYAAQAPFNPGYSSIAWYVTHDPDWFPSTYVLDRLGPYGLPTSLGAFWNSYQP